MSVVAAVAVGGAPVVLSKTKVTVGEIVLCTTAVHVVHPNPGVGWDWGERGEGGRGRGGRRGDRGEGGKESEGGEGGREEREGERGGKREKGKREGGRQREIDQHQAQTPTSF